MSLNEACLIYPGTDYYVLLRFLGDSIQHPKQSLEEQGVQNKLSYHRTTDRDRIKETARTRKKKNLETKDNFCNNEYF